MEFDNHSLKVSPSRFCLIGLTSTTGPTSGKSYTADRILDMAHNCYGIKGFKLSMASPVKIVGNQLIQGLWGVDASKHPKDTAIPGAGGLKPRDIYIQVGSRCVREKVHKDMWLWVMGKAMRELLHQHQKHPILIVIDDIRFLNEWCFIMANGGETYDVRLQQENGEYVYSPVDNDELELKPGSFDMRQNVLSNVVDRRTIEKQIIDKVLPYIAKHLSLSPPMPLTE